MHEKIWVEYEKGRRRINANTLLLKKKKKRDKDIIYNKTKPEKKLMCATQTTKPIKKQNKEKY